MRSYARSLFRTGSASGLAVRIALVTGLLGATLAPGLVGQTFVPESGGRGWIGISVNVVSDEWNRPVAILISDVSDGSPAAEAGLRPGDRVVAINQLARTSELAQLSQRLRLVAGDPVIVEVERAGGRHRVRLTAVTRPQDIDVQQTVEFGYSVDMVDTWVRAMDSLRIELVREGRGQTVRVRFMDEDGGSQRVTVRTAPQVAGRVNVVLSDGSGRPVKAPFEFFVFRGEDHDSLRNEMVDLNRTMDDLQGRLVAREVEVRRRQGREDVRLREDREFVRLSELMEQASSRSAGLETAMALSAREKAGLEYTQRLPGIRSVVTPDRPAPQADFRPLTPYLLGRNRVAGAEVTDLEPRLAEYFGVVGGVLVLGVSEGTPAALAGIVPGDVIVRLDQVGIRSVEDLRRGVSMAGETLPVSLIRQGASMQVLLRRQ